MKSKHDIGRQTEEVLNCLDGIEKAETQPFFYTRLKVRMEGGITNRWNWWMAYLSKPAVSLSLLLVFLMINGYIIFNRLGTQPEMTPAASDYAVMQVSYLEANPELP